MAREVYLVDAAAERTYGKLQINLNFCQPHLRSRTPPEKTRL